MVPQLVHGGHGALKPHQALDEVGFGCQHSPATVHVAVKILAVQQSA